MNTKLLFCIKANKQLVKLGKHFADFNFHGSRLTAKYLLNLNDAKISHFTVLSVGIHIIWHLGNQALEKYFSKTIIKMFLSVIYEDQSFKDNLTFIIHKNTINVRGQN